MTTDHGQYMTPVWAARQLWDELFGDATARDVVVEPTCGDGRMLAAIPSWIEAHGYEIDPLRGMRLYVECDLAAATRPVGREEMVGGSGRGEDVVRAVLRGLGGRERLAEVYAAMLGRLHADKRHWQEKIRQVLQRGPFRNVGRGEWALAM